jgi:hypothetical protein
MARQTWDDEDAWDGDAPEDFADEESNGDDEPTIPCPYCGQDIHEDSPRCPHCENYLSQEDSPPAPKPWWFLIGAGLGLLVFLRWLFL